MSKSIGTRRDLRSLRGAAALLSILLGGSGGLGLAAPGAALAAEPDGHGWWSRLNDGATSPAAVPPPDVPSDGLYVAGDVAGPQALAAVSFTLAGADVPAVLTLLPAGSGVRGGVAGCAIPAGRVVPSQNGRWTDAPSWDAERCVDGTAGEDGIAFDVSSVAGDATGYLAIAIVPAGAASRAVFAAPGPDALTTTPAAGEAGAPGSPAAGDQPAAGGAAAAQPAAAAPAESTALAGGLPPPMTLDGPAATSAGAPAGTVATGSGGQQRAFAPLGTPAGAGWYGALGAAVGGVLLFGLLLFYSLGYGPLGARYDR